MRLELAAKDSRILELEVVVERMRSEETEQRIILNNQSLTQASTLELMKEENHKLAQENERLDEGKKDLESSINTLKSEVGRLSEIISVKNQKLDIQGSLTEEI